MKVPAVFFCLLLAAPAVRAQDVTPVRLIATVNYQYYLLGQDPANGSYHRNSLAHAATYIREYRAETAPEYFALANAGNVTAAPYALFRQRKALARIDSLLGYDTTETIRRGGLTIAMPRLGNDPVQNNTSIGRLRAQSPDIVIGLFCHPDVALKTIALTCGLDVAIATPAGLRPEVLKVEDADKRRVLLVNPGVTGRYAGMLEVTAADKVKARLVDITGLPAERTYVDAMTGYENELAFFMKTPLATVTHTTPAKEPLAGGSEYAAVFHRFQLETTGADISLFAPSAHGVVLSAGEIDFSDVLDLFPYANTLMVAELTGMEIRNYLEYVADRWFVTMSGNGDDLLRTINGSDGIRPALPAYHMDTGAGILYTIHLARNPGHKIEITAMADGTRFDPRRRYRVATNSFRLASDQLARGTGLTSQELWARVVWQSEEDYRLLLREWLFDMGRLSPENPYNPSFSPAAWYDAAMERL
ncbi:MAG: 5'-nucleotidase C-terminal domain-containing protein [Rikenellaceae bacterium]|jgi:2',3'-cyclic-nucleotide 2'-phosphodiesterase (5'-nucleotidase family)|nr:5'-nucleotidase C-terminal domain-containing protein [Rikenellaceae bacterium]